MAAPPPPPPPPDITFHLDIAGFHRTKVITVKNSVISVSKRDNLEPENELDSRKWKMKKKQSKSKIFLHEVHYFMKIWIHAEQDFSLQLFLCKKQNIKKCSIKICYGQKLYTYQV